MPALPRRAVPATLSAVTAVAAAVLLAGCGAPASDTPADTPADTAVPASTAASPAPTPDPVVAAYCATVVRVQQEQTSPQAGQGSLTAASDAARRQVGDLAASAPPEIAGDWQQLAGLTDQALGSLTATGGDPNRIDRGALTRLQAQSQPAVERIKQVTAERCGVAFRPPA